MNQLITSSVFFYWFDFILIVLLFIVPSLTLVSLLKWYLNGESIISNPITSNPIISNPIVSNFIVYNPITTNPITSNPIISNPITSNPITSNLIISNPIISNSISKKIFIFSFLISFYFKNKLNFTKMFLYWN